MSAETVDGGRLREAAKRKSDESILLHIADKDCVALEVKYHKRCYDGYTSFLRCTGENEDAEESEIHDKNLCKYEESFDVFCERFVKARIINNDEIHRMKKIEEEFVKTVEQVEGIDASNYRRFRLKERLLERFPQLVFHTPKKRNKSEIVYAKSICKGAVAEHYLSNEGSQTSHSDTETEDEVLDEQLLKNPEPKAATLKEVYNVALTLRNILRSCTQAWYETWPPLASDITGESVMKLVTPLLFNFVTWLLGFSEDAEASEYVEVDEKHAVKVFSICQDLINISSKGKIQTPKSLALAMAVRQITGCSSLINILNGLGHCVSLSSTMAYDSALAQLTINTSNIIPMEFVAEEYVNLVFDNIDFGEEISKQTHVTNGIITQKMAIRNESELPRSTVIKKSQRTVEVPSTVISEYYIGAKQTPDFHGIHHDTQLVPIELKKGAGQRAHKLDLAYVLTKMLCASDETPLPGWTGFNTMLHEHIPDVQRVGYLPVINASPTEYSTIHEILKRSMSIAEKLKLKYAVLIFDEAVYSKIQHVRWKERIFYDKFIVRLGEFHTIMSFLSAVSKIFEDGGLKVS